MKRTDTAHEHWNTQWANIESDSKWLKPEDDVIRWADTLEKGAKILDLGAGVGRHALWLASQGFEATALDAASDGLAAIDQNSGVKIVEAPMTELPFTNNTFDHIVSWNVIYHGNEDILLTTLQEIRRVLKSGGQFMGTMLSNRRLPFDHARMKGGREISRNTWVFENEKSDKRHPHYYCSGLELLTLFSGFEILWLKDQEHESKGSFHWHMIAEKL
tara:strand:+ start:278 stop:928 length:651 start_codon:yes stop_codon:yes gene_type:complete